MLLHNKRSGNIVIKSGNKVITFKSNSVSDIDNDTAAKLVKMYPGLVVEVKGAKADDGSDETSVDSEEQETDTSEKVEEPKKGGKRVSTARNK